jgi:hypothetical protein
LLTNVNGCNMGPWLLKSHWLLWKITGCYRSHWLFLEVTGCYVKSLVAMEILWLKWISLVAVEVNGCYGKSMVTMKFISRFMHCYENNVWYGY